MGWEKPLTRKPCQRSPQQLVRPTLPVKSALIIVVVRAVEMSIRLFVGPDSAAENVTSAPQRTVYVGVSTDAKLGGSSFTFTDYKIFTSPPGSLGAINGTHQIFPPVATDSLGISMRLGQTIRTSFSLPPRTWASHGA